MKRLIGILLFPVLFTSVLAQFINRSAAAVAHCSAEAADHLVDEIGERAAIGHAAFDAFGHVLARVGDVGLPVSIGRSTAGRAHRALAAHSAIGLESTALMEDQLAGAFIESCKERAEHDGRCARRETGRYVAAYHGVHPAPLTLTVPGGVVEIAAMGTGVVVWNNGEVKVEAVGMGATRTNPADRRPT